MEVLASFIQNILDLGAAVFLPFVIFILGVAVRMKVGKAFSSGLTLGVAFVGISLLITFIMGNVGEAAKQFTQNTGIQLKALDLGWPPALGLCWQWKYAFIMFPVQIGINLIMLFLGLTSTLNVDMWNVANKIFNAFLAATVTGSAVIGFLFAAATIVMELKCGDYTKHQVRELTGIPGISLPHPMFISNVFYYPLSRLLDFILPAKSNINATNLKNYIGVFGENHVMGFIIGTLIGLLGGYGVGASFMLGIQAGTALTLFPLVSKLFMTALTPLSDAANTFIKKRFPGKEIVIGLDWPILAGNPEIWVTIILTIPVALGVAMVLPGNIVFPFGNLMGPSIVAPIFLATKGHLIKMLIISYLTVPILCWSASDFAPMLSQLALENGAQLPDGQLMAWWGMDISEVRWIFVNSLDGRTPFLLGVALFVVLSVFYFKWMRKEEADALVRMAR
ncbi:MAG: PTS galactitol transporter subunit IIC [Deltaproteobacteria bacterium]|jgi:PTS system galactitol-specific IIC component|nr:PTS galactitol transporter subunit IIC [Deltaproteobacteria bacterium]